MYRKLFCLLLAVVLLGGEVRADEGMWMVQHLEKVYPQLRQRGVKLPLHEIYNEQDGGVAAAVVTLDGGMGTGSMISEEGLMITNHHVAYSDICDLSTVQRNYLEEGFWARSRAEEIPIRGKSVHFLRKVVDVTAEADSIVRDIQSRGKWGMMSMRKVVSSIEKKYARTTDCEVACVPMWHGKKTYLYYYDVYRDVRLVAAPPRDIAAFGGDFDNWTWPQHKGDFTIYRIYATPEGRPAKYSAENVPLRPRRVLTVSTRGVSDGDYAMVIGYPGRTQRYSSSYAIAEKQNVTNPIVVKNRHERMDILRHHMERDPEVRVKYADAFFSLSNFADYAKWENICLHRFGVADKRRAEEREMQMWVEADADRKAKYGDVLSMLQRSYAMRREAQTNLNYFRETWLGPSVPILVANRVNSHILKMRRTRRTELLPEDKETRSLYRFSSRLEGGYDATTELDLMKRLTRNFTAHVPRKMWGKGFEEMYDAAGGDVERMMEQAFKASFCSSAERYKAFLSEKRSIDELLADPLVKLAASVKTINFTGAVMASDKRSAGCDLHVCERRYSDMLYDYRASQGVVQYPNANSTMRLSYGRVKDLHPYDGVWMSSRSTVEGYLEKWNPAQYEWTMSDRMRELIAAKEWGRWGEKGQLYVNFITDNDITGGNSGSPVLNARGELIGLAFDGNRESMAGGVWFHPELSRTVCVDIRFVMWVLEKYAGADDLIAEMRLK